MGVSGESLGNEAAAAKPFSMNVHTLTQVQDLPLPPAELWAVMSCPEIVGSITPLEAGFVMTGDHSGRLYESRLLHYRLRILPGVWVDWLAEIKALEEGRTFVDEQRTGPFAFWHHRHTLEAIPGGTRMTDHVHYVLPLQPLGELAHPLVRPRLEQIFRYRREALVKRFGSLV